MGKKLKGMKKLNKAISAQLNSFGVAKAELGEEFCCYIEDNIIDYSLVYSDVDLWFNEYVMETFGYKVDYTFIISLLHEIGHINTIDDISDKAYNRCLKKKEKIYQALKEDVTEQEEKKLHFKYFNLTDEKMATAWAVEYARKHPKKIKKMWHKIYPAIIEFYNTNGIEY